MKPLISFVIPVWDGDAYLAETLESIRNQSESNIEIIVIDDHSPDFTEDLMQWYLKEDERIKYHRFDENKGVCEARNYGNNMAQTDLICVSDQDDISDKYRAKFSYVYMNKYPDVNCLTSAYWELDSDANKINKYVPDLITKESFSSGSYIRTGGWLHSSTCYRKQDILKLPYREVQGETDDHRFLTDWLNAGMKFATTVKVLANKRMGPNREMNRIRERMHEKPVWY